MTVRIVIDKVAEREFAEAVQFYEQCMSGLGQRFAREVHAFLQIVAKNPELYPHASRLTRKAKLPKPWPYAVFFVTQWPAPEIVIVAIWHGARDPNKLRRRFK